MDKTKRKASDNYPGVSPDVVLDDRTSPSLVEKDVRRLNNNPRNNDIDMPDRPAK